jgi:hypothetical protein
MVLLKVQFFGDQWSPKQKNNTQETLIFNIQDLATEN